MFNLLDNLARRLVRQGLRKAVLEGSTIWAVIGAAALLFSMARTIAADIARLKRSRRSAGEPA